jgi:hypothetical protein
MAEIGPGIIRQALVAHQLPLQAVAALAEKQVLPAQLAIGDGPQRLQIGVRIRIRGIFIIQSKLSLDRFSLSGRVQDPAIISLVKISNNYQIYKYSLLHELCDVKAFFVTDRI